MAGQRLGQRLEHHPLADGHAAQLGELAGVEGAGVRMGEETGLGSDEAAAFGEVVDRRSEAVLVEPGRRRRVTELRAFTEGEESLVAARRGTGAGDGEDLFGAQVGGPETGGRLRERAVAAPVLAEHRERDEDLRGKRDARPEAPVTNLPRLLQQLLERQRQQLGVAARDRSGSLGAATLGGGTGRGSRMVDHLLTLPKALGADRGWAVQGLTHSYPSGSRSLTASIGPHDPDS